MRQHSDLDESVELVRALMRPEERATAEQPFIDAYAQELRLALTNSMKSCTLESKQPVHSVSLDNLS